MIIFLDISMGSDDRAFIEELYDKYGELMLDVALKLLYRHTQDSEDAVQDAFIRLSRVISTLRKLKGNKLEGYIVKTVRSAATDLLRVRHPERNVGEGLIPFIRDKNPSVEDEVMSRLNLERLTEAILRLKGNYRIILYLHDVIGWSDKELAVYLNLAPSSVRVYLKKAREAVGLKKGRGLNEEDSNE